MRRRNDHNRDDGYRGRDHGQGRSGYDKEDRNYRSGVGSFRGSSDYGDDRYFGGSRQYGEGYSGSSHSQDWGDRDRGFRGTRNYGDDATYYNDRERSRAYGRGYRNRDSEDYGSRDYGYGRSGYEGSYSSGLYGGGIGGYSGGGYQGYNPGSYRSSDYRTSRGYYSPDYPESESGYYSGRSGRDERGWWDKTSDEVAAWFGDEEAERRREMDRRYDGGYRGKGPKGYSRSDDRIVEDVSDRLEDHSYIDASDIEVEVNSGEVILSGTVESRYAKRLAEDLAEDCSGVKNVENRIRVDSDWYDNHYQTSSASGTTTGTTDNQARSAVGK